MTPHPPHPRTRRALLALALLAAAACARAARRQEEDGAPVPQLATLVFRNESMQQADVFAVPETGGAVRIGTVLPGRTDTLTIYPTLLNRSPLNIVARLVGRRSFPESGFISFSPGDRLCIILPMTTLLLTVLPAPDP